MARKSSGDPANRVPRTEHGRIYVALHEEGLITKQPDGFWAYRKGESDGTVAARLGPPVEEVHVRGMRQDLGWKMRAAPSQRPRKRTAGGVSVEDLAAVTAQMHGHFEQILEAAFAEPLRRLKNHGTAIDKVSSSLAETRELVDRALGSLERKLTKRLDDVEGQLQRERQRTVSDLDVVRAEVDAMRGEFRTEAIGSLERKLTKRLDDIEGQLQRERQRIDLMLRERGVTPMPKREAGG